MRDVQGSEVFQGIVNPEVLAYSTYFGPTSDQALNPFPGRSEQNIERRAVCEHVAASQYASLFQIAWGVPLDCSSTPVEVSAPDAEVIPETAFDISYKRIVLAVGAWQHSGDLNSFSSRRDIALRSELACLDASSKDLAPYYDVAFCRELALDKVKESWGKFPLKMFTAEENLGHDLFYNIAPPGSTRPPPFPDLPVTQCAL